MTSRYWIILILAALTALILTRLSIHLSVRLDALDLPNERSSHSQPMPRLGGLGMAWALILLIVIFVASHYLGWALVPEMTTDWLVVILSGLAMAATGLWDDLYQLRASAKYLAQFAVAAFLMFWGYRIESVGAGDHLLFSLGWVGIPLTLIWITGFTNGFNFMDGINGISVTTASAYFTFFAFLAFSAGAEDLVLLALAFLGISLGALPWNFPRARTFIGDTGSLMLGMVLAVWVLLFVLRSPRSVIPLLLVCALYIWDTSFTLARRLWRGENIFAAHRSHLYQRLVQLGNSHAKITCLYLCIHVALGGMALLFVHSSGVIRAFLLGVAGLILVGLTLSVYVLESRSSVHRAGLNSL